MTKRDREETGEAEDQEGEKGTERANTIGMNRKALDRQSPSSLCSGPKGLMGKGMLAVECSTEQERNIL